MTKKAIVLLLVSILALISVLTACSSGNPKEELNSPTSTPTSSSSSSASAAPKDLHILLSHWAAPYAIEAKEDDKFIQELSKLSGYNLKYEFLGHNEDYRQQLSLRFSSNDLADLIRTDSIQSTIHTGAVDQGVFMELGPLIDKFGPNLKKKIPEKVWDSPRISKDGKIFAIPTLVAHPVEKVVIVRQDWLDKLDMQTPATVDDFLKFCEAVKVNDMNGNGDPNDEYCTTAFEVLNWSLFMFQSFGADPETWQVQDGIMLPGIIRPEMKEAIAFYRMMYEKGYINQDMFTQKEADNVADIFKGKTGMWTGAVQKFNAEYSTAAVKKNYVDQPDAKVNIIVPPGGKGLNPEPDGIYFAWVIPTESKNAEEAIKFLDWAWSDPKADTFFSFGIEGVNHTKENGEIKYDINSPANVEKSAFQMYQLSMNIRGRFTLSDAVIATLPESERIIEGYKVADQTIFKHDSFNMPKLQSLNTHPELVPGVFRGTLFLDMFAKVVTGKEELDPAFDNFVAEWKRRGGDAAIQEATDWYNGNKK